MSGYRSKRLHCCAMVACVFVGMVPDARLRDLYEGAVALFYPSLYEGFGMPVIEAMSCGTQVVHSEGTSMDEISGDFGLRLPPTDIDAWTCAIRTVIDQASSQQSAITRQKRIDRARLFDWARSADQVQDRLYGTGVTFAKVFGQILTICN